MIDPTAEVEKTVNDEKANLVEGRIAVFSSILGRAIDGNDDVAPSASLARLEFARKCHHIGFGVETHEVAVQFAQSRVGREQNRDRRKVGSHRLRADRENAEAPQFVEPKGDHARVVVDDLELDPAGHAGWSAARAAALKRLPSARPCADAVNAFITMPRSLGPVAPVSAIAALTSSVNSSSVNSAGK